MPATLAGHAVAIVLALAALARVAAVDGNLARAESVAVLEALACLGLAALSPRAARTSRAAARRAGCLALVLLEALAIGTRLEAVALPVAWIAAAIEIASYLRERTPDARAASPKTQALAKTAFAVALAIVAIVFIPIRLASSERRVDLASLERRHGAGHDTLALLPLVSLDAFPETAVLAEDGKPLPFPDANHEDVAAIGSGRYAAFGRVVHFSSSDGTDPLANGRRYELAYRPEPQRSTVARLAVAGAILLLFVAWAAGAVALDAPSSRRERIAALGLVALALAAGLPGRWNRIEVARDSAGYVRGSFTRTILYPTFVSALDRTPQERLALHEPDLVPREDPGDRWLNVVRVQKVLAAVAVVAFLAVLASALDAWALAALAAVAMLADQETLYAGGAISENVGALLSDGLNHGLVFLYLGATLAYLLAPSWERGVALAATVALLLLNRPANGVLASALALVWVLHARREGARPATVRAGGLAAIVAIPLLLACAHTYSATGHFRLHAFSGRSLFCTAFEVATPDDLEAFPEPDLHALVKACLDESSKRVPVENAEWVNVNLYGIGLPAIERLHLAPDEFAADDLLLAVGKRLVRRHPGAFARNALAQVATAVPWERDAPLALVVVFATVAYARRRRPLDLFFAFFAALPVLAILPACVLNAPIPRYGSQLGFAELVAPLAYALFLLGGDRDLPPSAVC